MVLESDDEGAMEIGSDEAWEEEDTSNETEDSGRPVTPHVVLSRDCSDFSCSAFRPATFLSLSRNVAGMSLSLVVLILLVSYLSLSRNVAACVSSFPSRDLEWNRRTAGLQAVIGCPEYQVTSGRVSNRVLQRSCKDSGY